MALPIEIGKHLECETVNTNSMATIETGIQISFLPLMNGHILSQNVTLLSHHNFVEKKPLSQ